MDELNLISKGLYRILSIIGIIAREPIIALRRMVMDVGIRAGNVACMVCKLYKENIFSGSKAEGFRFESSDYDNMFVRRGIRAVFSPCLSVVDNTRHTILLAETDTTKPGFAILRLIHQSGFDQQVMASLVKYGSGNYLSTTLWVRSGFGPLAFTSPSVHGPCISGMLGRSEVDHAECISSDSFPTPAYRNLLRLYRGGKLSCHGLQTIRLKGCHFVAIGSKRPVHESLEWRISFSFAEKMIIHSFNHTQFLCYGLLKLFLKEAIESNVELKGLLCSYFMKTAVFWMSLHSSLDWTPENLLCCFLKCLQLLLDWVACEYCPSFFIPENNMVADKFTRRQHTSLLTHLSRLYHEGYQCLLRCPSISENFLLITEEPRLADSLMSILENFICKSDLDINLISEIWNYQIRVDSKTLPDVIQYLDRCEDDHQYRIICKIIVKNMYISEIALKTGIKRASNLLKTNSSYYQQSRAVIDTLKTCAVDATCNLPYCAVFLYRLGRYSDALTIANNAKKRLQHPSIMYPWKLR